MTETHVVSFVSRNKDNEGVVGFKTRHHSFILTIDNHSESLLTPADLVNAVRNRTADEFSRFVARGMVGEVSREYVTTNVADDVRCMKALGHALIEEEITLANINEKLASIVAKPCNCSTRRWVFDCDCSREETLVAMREIADIIEDSGRSSRGMLTLLPTMSNWMIVSECGFDTRNVLKNHPLIGFKKMDGTLFVDSGQEDSLSH